MEVNAFIPFFLGRCIGVGKYWSVGVEINYDSINASTQTHQHVLKSKDSHWLPLHDAL